MKPLFARTSFVKASLQILIATLALFGFLEILFRFVGAPGAGRFVEEIVIKEHLSRWKPEGEIRIFTFGESTMQGAHYAPVSTPARWLRVYLKEFLPDQKVRVVDFSRLGCGSDFILRAFKSTLIYKPDVAFFYMGHNVFLPGGRKDRVISERARLGRRIDFLSRRSYFISTVHRWVIQIMMRRSRNKTAGSFGYEVVETPPVGTKSEDMIPRGGPAYWENVDFFKANVHQILVAAKERGARALFFKPVSNLKDFAPSHSFHREGLAPEALSRWDELYQAGVEKQTRGDLNAALELDEQAYAIDPNYADLSFRLGQLHFKTGDLGKAREFFEEARDRDVPVVRATKDILAALEELKEREGLELIDIEKILVSEAPGGILGEPIIEDNVHLSVKGHSLMGWTMAEEIANRNWIRPKAEWRFDQIPPFGEIAAELGVNEDLLFSADLKMASYFGSRFDNRIRYAERALMIHPGDPYALRHLAWAHWLMGEHVEALEIYRKLEKINPGALEEVFTLQPEIKRAFRSPSL